MRHLQTKYHLEYEIEEEKQQRQFFVEHQGSLKIRKGGWDELRTMTSQNERFEYIYNRKVISVDCEDDFKSILNVEVETLRIVLIQQ